MRTLLIGAGAIGQVFGRHFQLGGDEVSFLVRPRYAEAARQGFAMYPLNRPASERDRPVRFEGFGVLTDQDAALQQPWDLIVLCVSSVALRSGYWFPKLAKGLGDARLLALQPGAEDEKLIFAHVPEERTAWGMLSVISYQAPLPHESRPEPGVAYWFPWLSGIGFGGSSEVVDSVTGTLKRGGMPVRRVDHVQTQVAFVGAILDKVVQASECASWSFPRLLDDPDLLPLAHRSMQEAWSLAEAITGSRRPPMLRLVRPFALRSLLRLAPDVMPLDLERFFAFHYVKIADQTVMMLDDQLARFGEHGVPCPATIELRDRLLAARSAAGEA